VPLGVSEYGGADLFFFFSQNAVEEMGDTDTVQVVDYKDVVQCLSAGGQGPK
jgi:hypothetical protein